MNALVVGASRESLHAIAIAQGLGYRVVAIDGSPLAEGLMAADEAIIADISNPEKVVSALDAPPSFVLPVPVGRVLVSTGVLNDRWGTPGISGHAASFFTDKLEFGQALYARGLRGAKCISQAALLGSRPLLDSLNYPVIVKPRYGSGSRGVSLAMTPEDALAALGRECDLVVEEVLPGVEYGLDGIVHEGKLSVLLLRKKENTEPPARQCVGYHTVSRKSPLYAIAGNKIQEILDVARVEDALVHADLMFDENAIEVIELSCRPSGHFIHDQLVPLATGVDPVEAFIRVCVCGEELPELGEVRSLYLGFFGFENCVIDEVPEDESVCEEFAPLIFESSIRKGDVFGPVTDGSVTLRGHFIIEENSSTCDMAQKLLSRFKTTPLVS